VKWESGTLKLSEEKTMAYMSIFGIFGLLLGLYAIFDLTQVRNEITKLHEEIKALKSGK